MHLKTVSHPIISAMQKRHFVLLDVLPFIGTVVGGYVLIRRGLTVSDWVAFIVMWHVGVIGIELGYHRYFSHSAFATKPVVRVLLAVFGSMAGQGPVVTWASTHRHHHNHSDTPEDTHSPYHYGGRAEPSVGGFIHSQLMWKWSYSYPNPNLYTPHLMRDPLITMLSRYYYLWVVLGLLVPGLIGVAIGQTWASFWTAIVFGGVIRLFAGQQLTFLINSFCHLMGARVFESKDQSRNVGWLVPLTLGGSLHNSHHAFPTTANNGLLWWQVDPGYWIIRALEWTGLVWDVRRISPDIVQKRRRRTLQTAANSLRGAESVTAVAEPVPEPSE